MEDCLQNPYLNSVYPVFGRVLSLIDFEATSATRGCFDRTWWNWKFTDFPAPRLQEGIYTLSWLFVNSKKISSIELDQDMLLESIVAGINFWCKKQHNDGSFDEAYPFERSLAATSFTTFYIGHAILLVGDELPVECRRRAVSTIKKAGTWLSNNGEYHGILSNHLAAAAGALQIAKDITGDSSFSNSRNQYLHIIYREQDLKEGWMREYGGADPGYQSHGMFYLADIWKRNPCPELFQRLEKACEFMSWFIHPDGSCGGEYASRGTKFLYPAAFEILGEHIDSAANIASFVHKCLKNNKCIGPKEMDIWNLFPMTNNYLFAEKYFNEVVSGEILPWQKQGAYIEFPNAGLLVKNQAVQKLVASQGYGGSIKLWDLKSNQLIFEDYGYFFDKRGKSFVSQSKSDFSVSNTDTDGLRIKLKSNFTELAKIRFSSTKFILFRSFNLSFGRLHKVALWLKNCLVKTLINKKDKHDVSLERNIHLNFKGQLNITDCIRGTPIQVNRLSRHVPFHMGSARYSQLADWQKSNNSSVQHSLKYETEQSCWFATTKVNLESIY